MSIYSKVHSKVRTSQGTSESFSQDNRLMQGECLSPTLFALYINEIETIMNLVTTMGASIGNLRISGLKYAVIGCFVRLV